MSKIEVARLASEKLSEFVLKNMDKEVPAAEIEIEFSVLYSNYSDALDEAINEGNTEEQVVEYIKNKNLTIPSEQLPQFFQWFLKRFTKYISRTTSLN